MPPHGVQRLSSYLRGSFDRCRHLSRLRRRSGRKCKDNRVPSRCNGKLLRHRGNSAVPSQSRVQASAEFRTALEPYGRWQRHSRWGDVWIPANRPRDWRPYTLGRWVYTDDWGWYWISDNSEARWGWATYHYGRWVFDDDARLVLGGRRRVEPGLGAMASRRRRRRICRVGAAAPDEVVVTYRDEPRFWIFVRGRDFIAPRIASIILPIRQYDVFIRQTVIVNRTVVIRDRGRFAVNPGIAPNIIAKFSGRPLRTFDVRPVVLAGTAQIPGAMQVRAQDVRGSSFRAQTTVRQTQNTVRAADRVQAPQPLAAGERGRLGDNPPRAAQSRPSTTGQTPGARDQQPQQGQQQQQQQPQQRAQRAQQTGAGADRRDAAEPSSGSNRRRPSVVGLSSASSGSSPAAKGSSRSKRREPKVAAEPSSGNSRRNNNRGAASRSRRRRRAAAEPSSGNNRRRPSVGGPSSASSGSSPAAKGSSRSKRREPKVAAEPSSSSSPAFERGAAPRQEQARPAAVAADRVRRRRNRAASPASPRVAAGEE